MIKENGRERKCYVCGRRGGKGKREEVEEVSGMREKRKERYCEWAID